MMSKQTIANRYSYTNNDTFLNYRHLQELYEYRKELELLDRWEEVEPLIDDAMHCQDEYVAAVEKINRRLQQIKKRLYASL